MCSAWTSCATAPSASTTWWSSRTAGASPHRRSSSTLLLDPRSVITTEIFARRHGLRVERPRSSSPSATCGSPSSSGGCSANEGPARVLDGNFVLMDIAAAQWAFDRLGRVDRVEIRLPAGRNVADAERLLVVATPARPHRAAPGAARRAGRDDAAGVPFQPDRAVVRGAARGALPRLQHRCRLGDCAARRDRRPARGRCVSRHRAAAVPGRSGSAWRRLARCSARRRAGCSRRAPCA